MKNSHSDTSSPIQLKMLIEKRGISLSKFAKLFKEKTGYDMSSSAVFNLLKDGTIPKRIHNFKTVMIEFVEQNFSKELKALNIDKKDIFNQLTNNKTSIRGRNMISSIYLSQEARQHFKLKRDPFAPYLTQLSDIIMLQSHYYADEIMKTAAVAGLFAAITGEVGSGKSTIRDKFLEENKFGSRFITIIPDIIDTAHLNEREILISIVQELSEEKPKRSIVALNKQVRTLLKQKQASGEKCVLIIDEAQDININTLKCLKRLWEKKNGLTALLGIVLIGQPELETRLYGQNNTDVREVTARTTYARLEPINRELKTYLSFKIKQAGGNISNIITDDAINLLNDKLTLKDRNNKVQHTAYPLETGNIMKLLMNKAVMSGEELVTKEVVESINL